MSKKQMGFTLIEIVMVLVLLGILSAVAVPKYFDLQKQAEFNAAKATVAEYQARLNARFASALLDGNSCSDAVIIAVSGKADSKYTGALAADDFGGWSVSLADTTKVLTVTRDSSGNSYPGEDDSNDDFKIVVPTCSN